jgi:Arc/MetJ family transcription regulator
MARPKVTVNLDADLVIEVMVLSGIRNAQDAIEAIARDYVAKGQRTEAVTGTSGLERAGDEPGTWGPERQ